ncbi:MAG: GH92 family glycosyl hydrolase [Tannerellaceae bacterium]|jgi:predicted alpha-1,2-mannosidase|nr:GH92 family glycosyl hydrolase [Tannerellaceae bacterium]
MKKRIFCFLFGFIIVTPFPRHEKAAPDAKRLSDYVNPFIGASTSIGAAGVYHGLGKTIPGATSPFGMVQLSPNTITGGDNGPGYSYEHETIEGFAFTQMSGIGWFGDLGNFLVMPSVGQMKTNAGRPDNPDSGYRCRYDKKSETAKAGYYAVELTGYGIKTEATVAPHSGILRFTFPENKQSRIQIDLARRVGGTSTRQYIKVVDSHTIKGWMECTPAGGGWGNGDGKALYTVHFYAQFSKPLTNCGVWSARIPEGQSRKREDIESDAYQQLIADAEIIRGADEFEGKHIGFFTEFETAREEVVCLKAGISFVDMDGAEKNLKAEMTGWDFDTLLEENSLRWDNALAKMTVEGGSDDRKTIFYTALYHTMTDPRIYTDVDGRYVGGDYRIHTSGKFTKRTIFSGWDVFRSQMPLQTIINPDVVNDMLNSLITMAGESGREYFERWEFLNAYTGCMLGNPAISVLTDAYAKGIRDYDIEKAYRYAINTSERFGNGKLGYSPGPGGISTTLEHGYSEWCVSELAGWLGHTDDRQTYLERSGSYKNIFDKEKNSFRPRQEDGAFYPWPEEGRLKEGYGCAESNPYQQGWFVPHDIEGLAGLMGGREQTLADLDSLFEKTPSHFLWNEYYNHANEPVHHIPYLYNRLGEPWKTQKWTRYICENAYSNRVEGLVGNEDVGQMSAWYVLSAAGIHPVCPGETRFEITSPVFDRIDINLATGKTFSIIALNNSPRNVYIQSAKLNGSDYNKCYIDYQDIIKGGALELTLTDAPE